MTFRSAATFWAVWFAGWFSLTVALARGWQVTSALLAGLLYLQLARRQRRCWAGTAADSQQQTASDPDPTGPRTPDPEPPLPHG